MTTRVMSPDEISSLLALMSWHRSRIYDLSGSGGEDAGDCGTLCLASDQHRISADHIRGMLAHQSGRDADGFTPEEVSLQCAYQIVGSLSDAVGLLEHPEVQRALDFLSDSGDQEPSDFLPWPRRPLSLGWLRVPETATPDMIIAAQLATDDLSGDVVSDSAAYFRAVWAAMASQARVSADWSEES